MFQLARNVNCYASPKLVSDSLRNLNSATWKMERAVTTLTKTAEFASEENARYV